MQIDNKALMLRWFNEVWNEGRAEAIDELFAEDGIGHGLTDAEGNELRGPAAFKQFYHRFRGAFPDIQIVVEGILAEGDLVAAWCSVRATHLGDTLGFRATSAPISITGICITRWKNGKIEEAWNNFDFMAMFQQLGAIQFVTTG